MLPFIGPLALLLSGMPIVKAADTPDICIPASRNDQKNNYRYYDMTDMCKKTGHCKEACVIFIQSTACARAFDKFDNTEVQSGLAEQVGKDGALTSSRREKWYFSFDGFTTAIPNQPVRAEFFTALSDYMNSGYPLPLNIYFYERPVGSDQKFGIDAVRDNCQ